MFNKLTGKAFLSTPSVGRATIEDMIPLAWNKFLSTPSVGRATMLDGYIIRLQVISIHALRGEGDMEVLYYDEWNN